jgi:hypothetical protein
MKKLIIKLIFSLGLVTNHVANASDYNPGPDPKTKQGKAFIDLYSNLPEYSVMSEEIMDEQKFRYIFGTMITRTRFEENAVKIFFVGQDATHIAEASKQPGTSGFGGRVQALANYFGVDQSVATTNAFLSTIKGQYGSANHVFIEKNNANEQFIRRSTLVDNQLWSLAHDENSEIRKTREHFFEWMIKNNPESLKLMVLFGGAAKDSFAEFLLARGAEVPSRLNPDRLKNIKVPSSKIVPAGGNNTFAVLLTKEGQDLYQILLKDHPQYKSFLNSRSLKKGIEELDYSNPLVQKAAEEVLERKGKEAIKLMTFIQGGQDSSGIIKAAQIGGYDLSKVRINGKETQSLKGLKLSDGTIIEKDLAFIESMHPTALSMMMIEKGEKAVAQAVKKSLLPLEELKKMGWQIEPDKNSDGSLMENQWHSGKDFDYGRGEVGASFFEFGAPADRRANTSSATREGAQIILAGTKNTESFDKKALEAAKQGLASETLNYDDLWSVRPRNLIERYQFDRGPGKDLAKILYNSIDQKKLFQVKPGLQVFGKKDQDITFQTHGIDAYYTKTHPDTGLFGFHRGDFKNSEAFVLADPHGVDDWNTSRALTGARGQFLNRMMYDLGINDKYLVVKTVPVGMDQASPEDWEHVRKVTEKYREIAIEQALKNPNLKYFFTDGEIAKKEMQRILSKLKLNNVIVINIEREGLNPQSGIVSARKEAQKVYSLNVEKNISEVLQMKDLPRTHLTWWSRSWEGTSGDRVIEAIGKERGKARALIAPNWVARQKIRPLGSTQKSIEKIRQKFELLNLRIGTESLLDFLNKASNKMKIEKNLQKPSLKCEGLFQ